VFSFTVSPFRAYIGLYVMKRESCQELAKKNFVHRVIDSYAMAKGTSEVLQGTLDLMVLTTLDAMGPLHGYGIARRIEQLSEQVLQLNEGTVYTSLLRLQQRSWISSSWGISENNRKARFYSITKSGRKQLASETKNWERISGVIGRVLLARQR
jgi:PadR family transcriptional regulator PadR